MTLWSRRGLHDLREQEGDVLHDLKEKERLNDIREQERAA